MTGSEPDIAANGDSCESILDYLARFATLGSVAEAWAMHTERMARYGFDRIIYSFASLPAHVDVLEDTLLLSNHPRSFLDPFLHEGRWRRPLFLSHAETTGQQAVPWRLSPDMPVTPDQRRALAFRAAHGVVAGYTISFHNVTPQGRAGTGLCARRGLDQDAVDAIWRRHGRVLLLMNMAFHLRVATLPMPLPARSLSPRQAEVLGWISKGKTVQDIATILGVQLTTVDKHLRLAREALGAQTTAQAMLKASLLNQLFRLDPPEQPVAAPRHRPG